MTNPFRTAAGAALALVLSAVGVAPAWAAVPETGTATLTVTAPGGVGITNVEVEITAEDVENPDGAAESYSGTTNASGVLQTSELAVGTYAVSADVARFGKPASTQTASLTITEGADTALTVVMPGVQFITGTVTAFGEAIGDARVSATDGTTAYGVSVSSSGVYKLLVKQGPGYRLVLRPKFAGGPWLDTYSGDTVRLPDAKIITPPASAAAEVDIAAFDKTGELRGRVLTPSGKLAPDARVTACVDDRWGCFTTRSDSNGEFTLRGIPASTDVRLTADSFSPASTVFGEVRGLTVKVGATTTKDVTIRKQSAATDPGRILLTLDVPSAVVGARAACATMSTSAGKDVAYHCLGNGERKMAFIDLEAGTYRIGLRGTNISRTVTVEKGLITRVTMTRPAGATITGTVTTSAGAPAANAEVTITDPFGSALRTVTTSANGAYRVPFATSGTYDVRVVPAGRTYATTTKKSVTISGSKPVVNVILPLTVTLTGKVVDTAGKPVVGVHVTMHSSIGYATGKTNSKGVYALRYLPPGKHKVTTEDQYEGGYFRATSRIVTAPAGKTTTIPVITLRD